MRIAVLDDDPSIEYMFHHMVKNHNDNSSDEVEVTVFTDYRDMLKGFDYDLAILDLSLEDDKTGFDIARKIALDYPGCRMLIISEFLETQDFAMMSFMSKIGMKISEIKVRFKNMQINPFKNYTEIFMRELKYGGRIRTTN